MDEQTLRYLDDVRQRIISAMASATVRSKGHDEVVMTAQEAFAQVLPQLPALIEDRLSGAHARIFTAAELQRLLAEFAADMLAIQTSDLLRAVRPRRLTQEG